MELKEILDSLFYMVRDNVNFSVVKNEGCKTREEDRSAEYLLSSN